MASFKMTIPEGTNLWNAIGSLPAKARNAELYRLAATGLIADGRHQRAEMTNEAPPSEHKMTPVKTSDEVTEFMSIDLQDDLMGFLGEKT